jgi:hypothetical protein
MTWPEWLAARQLLMEEHLGVYLRQTGRDEDAAFRATASKVPREKHGSS